jgi:hypothetical protein
MSGKKLTLNPLEARKQLLIAESEINRTLLIRDCHALAGEICDATHLIGKAGALILSAKALLALFKSHRASADPKTVSKNSWWAVSLNLLRLGLPLWLGLHQRKAAATNAHGQASRPKAPESA